MTTLEKLLIELLGTQEDVKNFKQRFNSITPSSIQILLSKCLEIFQVRNMTIEILKEIHNRETLIRRLKLLRPEDLKPKVIEIIKLSKILRKKIHD